LLPLMSLLTVLIIAALAEGIARRYFWTTATGINNCLVLNDADRGITGIPNSVCWEKISESQLVEYRFDCLGYRTGKSCGPKASGTYKIAAIGSSTAMGMRVPIEHTLTAVLPEELSRLTGRRIEVDNFAMAFGFPRNAALRMRDVLAGRPDL